MHKDSKLRRKEIARQLAARQFAKAEKNGSAGAYVHKLREKPYALVYAEKARELRENNAKIQEVSSSQPEAERGNDCRISQ